MNWYLLIMLESALKASPSNHHFKLLLMKVYCSMGKFSLCLANNLVMFVPYFFAIRYLFQGVL